VLKSSVVLLYQGDSSTTFVLCGSIINGKLSDTF